MRAILDTGPLVALLNRADAFHEWAKRAFSELSVPIWTCEAVLAEAAYLTGKGSLLMKMVATEKLAIGLELAEQAAAVGRLLERYGARMDLADACLVRMSELHRQSRVITLDVRDFSFYRRNGREVIPLIAPHR